RCVFAAGRPYSGAVQLRAPAAGNRSRGLRTGNARGFGSAARSFAPTGPGDLALQTFTDQYTISDGNETIELYHVDGLNHSDNMLIAYLPKEKIAINADLYSPPPAGGNLANVSNNAVVLFRYLKRLKLDVAQHVPIHGNPGGGADFDRIVAPVAARTPAG